MAPEAAAAQMQPEVGLAIVEEGVIVSEAYLRTIDIQQSTSQPKLATFDSNQGRPKEKKGAIVREAYL